MTGLDPDKDTIMSIACFVTSAQLEVLDPNGFEAYIHHSKEALESMSEWCIVQHGASGLSDTCLASKTTAEEAAHNLLQYIRRFVREPQAALLAGNSVHADRAFLRKAPYDHVVKHLHHRIIDVSTVKELARRWAPTSVLEGAPKKAGKHDAREDILESIEEARYYKGLMFLS